MVYVFVAIIVVALVIYLGVIFVQNSNKSKIAKYQEQSNELLQSDLTEKLKNMQNQELTGKSLAVYESNQKKFDTIKNKKVENVQAQLTEAGNENKQFHFIKTHQLLKESQETIQEASDELNDISVSFENLEATNQANKKQVSELTEKFAVLNNQVAKHSLSFGPALEKIKARLSENQKDLTQVGELMESGDFDAAHDSLEKLETDLYLTEELVTKIPNAYNDLINEFPTQLDEIQAGYDQMTRQGFLFTKKDVSDELKALRQLITDSIDELKNLNLSAVETHDHQLIDKIDGLYDMMEQEFKAKRQVDGQLDNTQRFIQHAQKQNRDLHAELEHLEGIFHLSHDEMKTTLELQDHLKTINDTFQANLQKIADKEIIYSVVLNELKNMQQELTSIEEQQQQMNQELSVLQGKEDEAIKSYHQFELTLHNIDRDIKNLRLPGLNKKYRNDFLHVTEEVNQLGNDLNQSQLDLDDISKQMFKIQNDLKDLNNQTAEVTENAQLAELLIQYSNHYRHDNPSIEAAYEETQQLFYQEFDYAKAVEVIADALKSVDESAYERIKNNYEKEKDNYPY